MRWVRDGQSYFFRNGRPGLRLQDVFAPIAGEVAFSGSGALQTASLTTTLNDGLVITLRYTGSPISAARGDVHLLSIDTADGTVIRYGDPTAPRHEFSYQDLAGFHRGGAAAAAVAMAGDDRIVGSSNDEYLEGYAGDDALAGKAGADTLAGGTGDDTYIVDDPRAIVVEHLGEGVDFRLIDSEFRAPGRNGDRDADGKRRCLCQPDGEFVCQPRHRQRRQKSDARRRRR